jgi:hypothetical protein
MAKNLGKLGIIAGGIIATGPLVAACGGGISAEEWAATDGAAGRINLDDVQEAFKNSDSATDFERRVNEIYEGDGIIFIRARQDGEALTLEGWEDLNSNSEIDDAQDDLLFSIVKEQDQNTMEGHGANGYYRNSFGGGDFLFTYLLLSSFSRGPYFYNTPSTRGGTLRTQRTSYRTSSGYSRQVSKNSTFQNNQKKFSGSAYQNASRNQSSNRQTYKSTQQTSGKFKSSSTVSRSASGRAQGGGGKGGGGVVMFLNKGRNRVV